MSRNQTDVGARLAELEATVRGLTQELVEANERIRQLEAAVEEAPEPAGATALEGKARNGETGGAGGGSDDDGGRSTRQMGDDRKADDEAGSDLDDIIVA